MLGQMTTNRPGQTTPPLAATQSVVNVPAPQTGINTPTTQATVNVPTVQPTQPSQPTGGPLDPSQSTLSANFAPYVYDMLSMGQGLASLPFQPYTGERFAGPSQLQQQAFSGIGAFNKALGPLGSVQDYMSPYTQNVTDILAREATRQAEIQRQADQARLAQAGAYGGSRQAILDAERSRNLATQIGDIREKGLASAWEQAQKQRVSEAELGLKGLGTQLGAGEQEQRFAQAPLDFAYQQWQESMKWPYQQATFMSSLLGGLPLQAGGYGAGQSPLNALMQGIVSTLGLEKYLNQPPKQ